MARLLLFFSFFSLSLGSFEQFLYEVANDAAGQLDNVAESVTDAFETLNKNDEFTATAIRGQNTEGSLELVLTSRKRHESFTKVRNFGIFLVGQLQKRLFFCRVLLCKVKIEILHFRRSGSGYILI